MVTSILRSTATLAFGSGLLILCGCGVADQPTSSETPVAATAELAFQWGGQILVSATDGSGTRPAASSIAGGEQFHPDWSPDGESIVFAVDDTDGTRDLWVVDVESGDAERIVDCARPCSWSDEPAWSPDGKTIAFSRGAEVEGEGVGTISSVPATGGDVTTLFTAVSPEYPFGPRWSPDGLSIVFDSLRFATTDIADEDIVGASIQILDSAGQATVIAGEDAGLSVPDWSPDGQLILASGGDLWTIPVAGGAPTRLTDIAGAGGRALQSSWSADGQSIVFVYEAVVRQDPRVAVIPAAGGSIEVSESGTHPRLRP